LLRLFGREDDRLAEQRQDVLRVGVGNRQRLDAQLLLHLQSRETSRLLLHICIDELANTAVTRVGKGRDEVLLQVDPSLCSAKLCGASCEFGESSFDVSKKVIKLDGVRCTVSSGKTGAVNSDIKDRAPRSGAVNVQEACVSTAID